MITIVKVYDKQQPNTYREYCGRPGKGQAGLLGNPFWINDESQRNKACDDYATWFKTNKPKRVDELVEIAKTQDVELACFCQSPYDVVKKKCHCETIKQYIEDTLVSQHDSDWQWCMDYCKEHQNSPAQEWAWNEAKQALKEAKLINGNSETFKSLITG